MSEKKIEGIMRGFVKAIEEKNVEKALSFLTDDADYVTSEGTFKGKEELRRYLTWGTQTTPNQKVRDTGIGIMVKGNKAVFEHIAEGTYEGTKYEALTMCVYEFSDEKIQHLRTVVDRLSIAKQAAKGWFAKRIMNSIIARAEKGLH
jgi:predicted SnoaL-like aldol condensation-catalyzing enzyme